MIAMAEFKIEIAGQVFAVRSLFESTRDYCRSYLTDKPGNYLITVSQKDLLFEQAFLKEEALREGIRVRVFTDPFLERAAIQRQVADHLIRHGTVLLHGSAVAVDGEGYLFTARCGTGKSTHTRLWRQVFGQRAVMVNDDKPFLRFTGDGILACGSPWSGKHGLDTNISVPLRGICILKRGPENQIRRIGAGECREMLRQQCHVPEGMEDRVEALLSELAEDVAFWEMECTKDIQAAQVAFEAMGCV